MEVQLDFTDITIVEKDGIFKDVNELMIFEFPHPKWVLRSFVTIGSQYGTGDMELQFHSDKNIYIIEYASSSMGDLYYNPDIMAIATWARERGWNVPQPHESLAKKNKSFWKHFYDTLVIDSDYFDELYGERPQILKEKSIEK